MVSGRGHATSQDAVVLEYIVDSFFQSVYSLCNRTARSHFYFPTSLPASRNVLTKIDHAVNQALSATKKTQLDEKQSAIHLECSQSVILWSSCSVQGHQLLEDIAQTGFSLIHNAEVIPTSVQDIDHSLPTSFA